MVLNSWRNIASILGKDEKLCRKMWNKYRGQLCESEKTSPQESGDPGGHVRVFCCMFMFLTKKLVCCEKNAFSLCGTELFSQRWLPIYIIFSVCLLLYGCTGLPVCPELTRDTIPRSRDVGHFLSVTGTVIRTSTTKVSYKLFFLPISWNYFSKKVKLNMKPELDWVFGSVVNQSVNITGFKMHLQYSCTQP